MNKVVATAEPTSNTTGIPSFQPFRIEDQRSSATTQGFD